MARPGSVAVGGYYPTPPRLVPIIADLFKRAPGKLIAVDPCMGEGDAIYSFLQSLHNGNLSYLYGVEMEQTRYEAAKSKGWSYNSFLGRAEVAHGDCFNLTWEHYRTETSSGAGVLWLNPPYDSYGGRLEERFLSRFTSVLTIGGYLVYIVPYYALKDSAVTIATHYTEVHCFRFPDPDWEAYKQVVLVAKRQVGLMSADPELESRVIGWSQDASIIPILGESTVSFTLPGVESEYSAGFSKWVINQIDLQGLTAKIQPWCQTDRMGSVTSIPGIVPDLPFSDLLTRHYPLAMPPRPAHIAAGIAAGVFNGARIEPDNAKSTLPPILVKGVFDKEFRTVEERTNKDGEVTSIVQVQQPKLVTTVLDLRTSKFHTIKSSPEQTSAKSLAEMTMADLLKVYGRGLMTVMLNQCPVLHDPSRPADNFPLPELPRKLFGAQENATRGAIRLLGGLNCSKRERQGKAAIVLGEIGSGKCLGLGTLVLKYDGTRVPVEQIQKGDLLMGPDSTPRQVLSTTKGVGPLFRIHPTIGEPWVCNDAHILTLVHTMSDDVFDIPLQEYFTSRRISRPLTRGGRTSHPREEFKQFTPEKGVNFPPTSQPLIDPYFLGLWYGDGTKEEVKDLLSGVSITSNDGEIAQYLQEVAEHYGLKLNQLNKNNNDRCPIYHLTAGRAGGRGNPLLDNLRTEYGDGVGVPRSCLLGDTTVRKAFLAGFLDSDGHLGNGVYDFIQKRKQWSEDVCFIARSLGFRATLSPEKKSAYRGEEGGIYWRVCLSGDFSSLPIKLPRKMASPRAKARKNRKSDPNSGIRRMSHVNRTGITVEPIGEGVYAGFELDGDGRFLLGDFTVTHNTTVAMSTAQAIGSKHVLVMCPPHLLQGWKDQINTVLPWAEVVVLSDVEDVQRLTAQKSDKMVFAILSREAAKLGHALESVSHSCPQCGIGLEADDYAKRREVCTYQYLIGKNEPAKIAMGLARTLLPLFPNRSKVTQYVRGRFAERCAEIYRNRFKAEEKNYTASVWASFDKARLLPYVERLTRLVEGQLDEQERRQNEAGALIALLAGIGDESLTWQIGSRLYCSSLARDEQYGIHSELRRTALEILMLLPFTKATDRLLSELRTEDSLWREFDSKREGREGSWSWRYYIVKDGQVTYREHTVGSLEHFVMAFDSLHPSCVFVGSHKCNGPLYQSIPAPRRYPLANYIAKRHPKFFDLLILDEGHEYANENSAQGISAHRLTSLGMPTLFMTGTVMNGYAESLFANMWALSPKFREEFSRDEKQRFIDRYGYRKRVVQNVDKDSGKVVEYGSMSDRVERVERVTGNAPGVLPLFLLKHLLAISVTLHKTDLAVDLPKCKEIRVEVKPSKELESEYNRLQSTLLSRIKADRFEPDLAGKLWGALAELPSFLDRATRDTGNENGQYTIRYPESIGGSIVASAKMLSEDEILPKEQWMLDTLRDELKSGRNVMVFGWHTNLLPRLARLIETYTGEKCPILNPDKVSTGKRQDWIDREVVRKKRRVLVVNPVAIQTGLNNLVHFATEIWMQNPACNPITYRQAVGRVDRIGQRTETRIYFPTYSGTLQTQLYELLMHKVAVSLQTDGLDPESALAAAGAGNQDAFTGFSVGRYLYDLLSKEEAA